mmetsp:Transcript_5490/g.20738  ORF Transcript_5490/g.20738 Transcript_5490/m.20738 type:complete len:208 (-) Transcript_5490:822-1445(-)
MTRSETRAAHKPARFCDKALSLSRRPCHFRSTQRRLRFGRAAARRGRPMIRPSRSRSRSFRFPKALNRSPTGRSLELFLSHPRLLNPPRRFSQVSSFVLFFAVVPQDPHQARRRRCLNGKPSPPRPAKTVSISDSTRRRRRCRRKRQGRLRGRGRSCSVLCRHEYRPLREVWNSQLLHVRCSFPRNARLRQVFSRSFFWHRPNFESK